MTCRAAVLDTPINLMCQIVTAAARHVMHYYGSEEIIGASRITQQRNRHLRYKIETLDDKVATRCEDEARHGVNYRKLSSKTLVSVYD